MNAHISTTVPLTLTHTHTHSNIVGDLWARERARRVVQCASARPDSLISRRDARPLRIFRISVVRRRPQHQAAGVVLLAVRRWVHVRVSVRVFVCVCIRVFEWLSVTQSHRHRNVYVCVHISGLECTCACIFRQNCTRKNIQKQQRKTSSHQFDVCVCV